MAIPYFPMYAQDWLCDPGVSALTYEEQGVFFHLMCRMWQTSNCSLPDDDIKIARMLRINHNKWQRIKNSLSEVLTFSDRCFFSSRLAAEFKISEKKSQNNSETAKKREEVKRLKLLNNIESDSKNVLQTMHYKIREDKIREDKNKTLKELPPEACRLSGMLSEFILQNFPSNLTAKKQDAIKRWAEEIDKMNRIDGRTWNEIEVMIAWCQRDNFWKNNILSGAKLREKFDTLIAQSSKTKGGTANEDRKAWEEKFYAEDENVGDSFSVHCET